VRFVSRALLLAALLSLVASPAAAATLRSVQLEELTWTEVRDAIKAGATTIIIPIGGTEQNGPHMALGKHNARVKLLSRKIAAALGDTLVAPVVAYVPEGPISPASGHMRFPGTITLTNSAFESLLATAARGFKANGFTHVVFIGDHGEYQKALGRVAQALEREWKGEAHAHAIEEYYRAASAGFAKLLREKGYTPAEIGEHAGLADTSLTLAIDPALVRADAMGAAPSGPASGVSGDPRRASADLGRAGVDLIVARSVDAIRKAAGPR
jgi:creatinine amidohydrolase